MLSEYIGIIGAVAGSVSTLFVAECIRHIGSVKVFPTDVRIKYHLNSNFNNLVYEDRPKCDRHILSIPPKGIHSITQVYDMDDIDNVLVGVTKIVLKYKTLKMRYRKFVLYEGPALYPDTGKKA